MNLNQRLISSLEETSNINIKNLPPFKGTHIVRDPEILLSRAIFIISGVTRNGPRKKNLMGYSYQERLNNLDRNAGISLEIRRFNDDRISIMRNWNYNDDRFYEFRYEEMIGSNADYYYKKIFSHYGFSKEEIDLGVMLMKLFSFKNRTGRNVGEIANHSHLRSGKPADWKNYLTEHHKDEIKALFGDVIINLKYEKDNNW